MSYRDILIMLLLMFTSFAVLDVEGSIVKVSSVHSITVNQDITFK
jgi:hypothetical protein